MKKFFVVILLCLNIVALVTIIGYPEAEAIPRPKLTGALPQTTPEWEKSVLEAIPKVIAEYGENIKEAAQEYFVHRKIVIAMLIVESMGNPYAESPAGAKGCMQTLPSTDVEIGVMGNSFDCITSIWKGTKYFARLRDHYKLTPLIKVIAAYEKGPDRVANYTQQDLLKSDYLNKIAFVVEHLPENF
ncbi:MAG: lytic transglycosylase domain-containing protein [bacterium]|nr:lytic transglycosylase domain-containing protein [bacterium]